MKIKIGIVSTTHIDLHNDKTSKDCLIDMANQINKEFLPFLINHNLNLQIGICLYGEAFQLNDGEYALGVVVGEYDKDIEATEMRQGNANNVWEKYISYLDTDKLRKLNEFDNHINNNNFDPQNLNVSELLEIRLDSTFQMNDGTLYETKRFIAATSDLRIEVYPQDHDPKHFHVISKQRGINARFDINTLKLINIKKGEIKPKDQKVIQQFFQTYPEILLKLKSEHSRLNDI